MVASVVLDTSAVVAYLFDEPGGSTVEAALIGGVISAVNVSEVLSDFLNRGVSLEVALESLLELGLEIVPHDLDQLEGGPYQKDITA